MSAITAVLMDVVSIQKYVFASNSLRDNLGASHIVNNLFRDTVVPALTKACGIDAIQVNAAMEFWTKKPDQLFLDQDPTLPFEIGFAGGGKALILFRDFNTAKAFIMDFSRDLLIKAPGLQLAVAIDQEFEVGNNFKTSLAKLFSQLMENRNKYFPVTTLPAHGITATGSESGMSLNTYSSSRGKYVSFDTAAKEEAANDARTLLSNQLGDKSVAISFPSKLEDLGQTAGDSYIAVVHIDGNNIGDWFATSQSLADYRKRSQNMARITEDSFWEVVKDTAHIMDRLAKEPGFKMEDSLPIRPIIIGGDDLTFVCHGKLGLFLSEQYLSKWSQKANNELSCYGLPSEEGFTACAGVAIAKTKYPFYRTYRIAEELCRLSKKSANAYKKGSWMDYFIVSGAKSGTVEEIRKGEGSDGLRLHFGPYNLETGHDRSISHLKDGILGFVKDQDWPRSKLKELRSAFSNGTGHINLLLINMAARGAFLPCNDDSKYSVNYSSKGYSDLETPYFDMLEIMEFYPRFLL